MTQTAERVNIKRLAIDRPKPESFVFDPEISLPEEEFGDLFGWINETKRKNDEANFSNAASRASVLYPSRRDRLELDSEAQSLSLDYLRKTVGNSEYFSALRNFKVLFPRTFRQVQFAYQQVDETLAQVLDHNWSLIVEAANLKIAYPEKFEHLDFGDEYFLELKEKFKGRISSTFWSSMRVLFPERSREDFLPIAILKRKREDLEVDRMIPFVPIFSSLSFFYVLLQIWEAFPPNLLKQGPYS